MSLNQNFDVVLPSLVSHSWAREWLAVTAGLGESEWLARDGRTRDDCQWRLGEWWGEIEQRSKRRGAEQLGEKRERERAGSNRRKI
jgi:hypothetical protein